MGEVRGNLRDIAKPSVIVTMREDIAQLQEDMLTHEHPIIDEVTDINYLFRMNDGILYLKEKA